MLATDLKIGDEVVWREVGEGRGFNGPGKVYAVAEGGIYIDNELWGVDYYKKRDYFFWRIEAVEYRL